MANAPRLDFYEQLTGVYPFGPCPSFPFHGLFSRVRLFLIFELTAQGASAMEWVTPQHEEIDLNCEVSSYANAEL